mmetsp:Transcript_22782/g.35683  ORF Transcript_22782/g.35683 Transcript_22782/m.35683 type:complete len:101 (-) Transcript_22782:228-530(-)
MKILVQFVSIVLRAQSSGVSCHAGTDSIHTALMTGSLSKGARVLHVGMIPHEIISQQILFPTIPPKATRQCRRRAESQQGQILVAVKAHQWEQIQVSRSM